MKTTLYLSILTGLFIAVGFLLGGQNGAIIAFAIALAFNFFTYWFSDKIVLKMYRAKELPQNEAPELHQTVNDLANRAGIPLPKIYLVPLNVPNAFATGRNPEHAVVAVTPAILKILDQGELEGVLAHEISHIVNRDMLVSTLAATLAGAISILARMAWWGGIFLPGSDRNDRGGGALGFILLLIVTPILALLIRLAISRSREYLADASATKLIGHGDGLANALKKLHNSAKQHPAQGNFAQQATSHLFIVNPFKAGFLMSLFSTHPPMEERIKRLQAA